MSKTTKGYIVITEDLRVQYEEPGIYVGDIVHTDIETAMKEMEEKVQYAKTEESGDYDWLASALVSRPTDIREKWQTDRYVSFLDMYSGDKLNIYIHEITIE